MYIDENMYALTNFIVLKNETIPDIICRAEVLNDYHTIMNYKDRDITFQHEEKFAKTNFYEVNPVEDVMRPM